MNINLQNYRFSVGTHKEKNVIWVQFPKNSILRDELKQQFPSVKFSWTNKCWYLDDTKYLREKVGLATKTVLEGVKNVNVDTLAPERLRAYFLFILC